MNVREKTALAATGSNTILTVLKFAGAFLTGSQAILAEAMHSFSDILTSLFVFGSMRWDRWQEKSRKTRKKKKGKPPESMERKERAPAKGDPFRFFKEKIEKKVAFGIGLFLIGVSCFLFLEIAGKKAARIEYPLLSGLGFLLFALISYAISRFESNVGRAKGSMGLIADAQHQRSNMVGSLLTAFALILYHFGVRTLFGLPVDKIAAAVIALFMFSYGVETLFNAVRYYFREEKGKWVYFRTRSIAGLLLEKGTTEKLLDFLRKNLGLSLRGSRALRRLKTASIPVVLLAAIGLYLSTCFVIVDIDQAGVLERFGKPVGRMELEPGLHVKFPWPVDRVHLVDAKRIRRQTVGFKGDDISPILAWSKKHTGLEAPFLSGDDKYFNSYIVIHYRVKDAFQYLYGFGQADRALDDYAYRIYTETLARNDFYTLATIRREETEARLAGAIQEALDSVGVGLEIVTVNIKDLHPPIQVAPAYEDVVAAKQERERYVNQALGQKTVTLSLAKETRLNRLAEAKSYIEKVVNHAKGKAGNFLAQEKNYRAHRRLTDLRIYLETMKESLPKIRKIIVDPRSGKADLWLDLLDLPENWGPSFEEDEIAEEY